jgi:hypothetical protein
MQYTLLQGSADITPQIQDLKMARQVMNLIQSRPFVSASGSFTSTSDNQMFRRARFSSVLARRKFQYDTRRLDDIWPVTMSRSASRLPDLHTLTTIMNMTSIGGASKRWLICVFFALFF